MRLVTFQDKSIIDKLNILEEKNTNPIIEIRDKEINNKYLNLYNLFINRMKKELHIPEERTFNPIWCWLIPKNIEINDKYLNELFQREIISCNRLITIELEVPNELCFISNFEVWNELKFKCIFNENSINDNDLDKLFIKQKGAILQVAIPFLNKGFIKQVLMDENNFMDREYPKTEKEIKELHAKGEFLEG